MTCRSTCQWRINGDCRLSYWLSFAAAVRRMERQLGCVNVRPTLSQWEGRWSPSSTWNYVSTRKQQSTLQLTPIMKIAVILASDWLIRLSNFENAVEMHFEPAFERWMMLGFARLNCYWSYRGLTISFKSYIFYYSFLNDLHNVTTVYFSDNQQNLMQVNQTVT